MTQKLPYRDTDLFHGCDLALAGRAELRAINLKVQVSFMTALSNISGVGFHLIKPTLLI